MYVAGVCKELSPISMVILPNSVHRTGPNRDYGMTRAGQHARSSHKYCKPCAKHAHEPHTDARPHLYGFHLVEFSHQPVPVPVEQRVETTV